MAKSVVTFGEIMLRLTPPGFERLLQTPQFVATFGGAETNVAVALSGYGHPARFVTILPANHPITDAFVGEMRRFGVDTSCILRGKGRFAVYYVELGVNQWATTVTYDRDYSSMALAQPGDINWDQCLEGAGWLHLTGITPGISQGAADLALEAVRHARRLGLTISCDLNYRHKLWQYGRPATEVMPALFQHVDIGIIDGDACSKALGIEMDLTVEPGEARLAPFQRLAERVLDQYPNLKLAAMTVRDSSSASRTDWSACLHNRKEFLVSRHYQIDQIVDRLGNGDAFTAGLIHGILTGSSHQEALEFGVASGCLNHCVPGDIHRFNVEEVSRLLQSGRIGRVQR